MKTIDLSKGDLSFKKAESLIDDLGYLSYRHNRKISPNCLPHYFDFVFGEEKVTRYEERYQDEMSVQCGRCPHV